MKAVIAQVGIGNRMSDTKYLKKKAYGISIQRTQNVSSVDIFVCKHHLSVLSLNLFVSTSAIRKSRNTL